MNTKEPLKLHFKVSRLHNCLFPLPLLLHNTVPKACFTCSKTWARMKTFPLLVWGIREINNFTSPVRRTEIIVKKASE